MTTTVTTDHAALMWAEVADIGSLLADLPDEAFDEPSLCDGWLVRDVVGHMCYGHTTPMRSILGAVVKYRGNMTRGSFELSKQFAAGRSPAELREFWDRELVTNHARRGIAKTIRYTEGFLDHLIHNQDMRRPTGQRREIPVEHLVAALDLLPKISTPFFGTKKGVAGLRLVPTDLEHPVGDGPEVRGPAEALILAAAGRGVAFDELAGPGLAVLRGRVTS